MHPASRDSYVWERILEILNTRKLGGFALAGFLTLSLAFAACSGNDSESDDNNGDEPTATTEAATTPTSGADDGNDTPTPGGDEDPTNEPSDDNGDDGDSPLDRIREAAEGEEPQTYRLVYDMTAEDMTIRLTIASKPPLRMIKLEDKSTETDDVLVVIVDEESNYFCTSEGDSGQCIQSAGQEGPFGSLDEFLVIDASRELEELAAEDDVELERIGDRTVAGQDAECYAYQSAEGDGELCIGKDSNIVLAIDAIGPEGDPVRMEVVEYSDSPEDAEFEPPYPVIDFG
jgi:hypothetical protein